MRMEEFYIFSNVIMEGISRITLNTLGKIYSYLITKLEIFYSSIIKRFGKKWKDTIKAK